MIYFKKFQNKNIVQYLNSTFTSIAMIFAFVRILTVAVSGVGSFQECGDDDLERFFFDCKPVNTRKATKGTVKKYETWRIWRIQKFRSAQLPPPLDCENHSMLANAIAKFLCESRKQKTYRPYLAESSQSDVRQS
jgi:hypothetical protein